MWRIGLLLAAMTSTSGCAIFGGWDDDDDDECAVAPFGDRSAQLASDEHAPRAGSERRVVRAQNPDYSTGSYGTGSYGAGSYSGSYNSNGYGGRSVGATSPSDARPTGVNSQFPATPGSEAWGRPYSQPTTGSHYAVPGQRNAGQGYGSAPSNAPPGYIQPARPIGSSNTSPPANYASPSFSPVGSGGAVGANRVPEGAVQTPDPYVPATPVVGPNGPLGGFREGPGINPGPGAPTGRDPLMEVEPFRVIDIDEIVNETRTGRLMIGAGINSDAGLVGQFVIDEQNFDWTRFPRSWDDVKNGYAFRGGGQRFRFEAMPGTSVQRYLVSLQEPYLFDTPFSLGISAFFYDRRFVDWDEERVGGRIALGYQLPKDWTVTTSIRGEDVGISNPRVIPPVAEVAEVLGDNTLYGAKVAIGHDTRDDAFLPTQGHVVELGYEQIFGSFEYPIVTLEARKFFTLTERIDGSGRHVLHLGGQVGWAGGDTPVYDHFFAGGYSTIRGFGFRGASPKNGDVIVGGEFQILTTAEYMFPITADDMLRGVVFCDAGTVEEKANVDWSDFRVAPGFGLRISNAALGPAPIALDLAFPINHADGDKIRNFSFFIGLRY
jgi:outer membrane protein insertion porin family